MQRVIRRVAYAIIALFLIAFFIPFVGFTLFDGLRRNPRALIEFAQEPGCWVILAGPVLFWISLVAFYVRLPKEVRARKVGTLGRRYDFGAIATLFREYRRLYGFDWLLWVMAASGALTLLIVAMLVIADSRRRGGAA